MAYFECEVCGWRGGMFDLERKGRMCPKCLGATKLVAGEQPEGRGRLLSEAREWVLKHQEKGITCPCCDSYVRRWKRKFNSAMAHDLIKLYRLNLKNPGHFWHWKRFACDSRQHCLLVHWNFVESERQVKNQAENPKASLWRINAEGIAFALQKTPWTWKHVHVKDRNTFDGFSEEKITIIEALGDDFSYPELMAWEGEE